MGTHKKNIVKEDQEWYGIMLDDEVDAVIDYHPVRATGTLDEMKKEIWIRKNITLFSWNEYEAVLKLSKILRSKVDNQKHDGAIYLFRRIQGE